MEKTRKTKVIAIVALIVAVVGMSLGFAAFSNILTISSSATVTPNEEDFKMNIYGVVNKTPENLFDIQAYTSETIAIAAVDSNNAAVRPTATNALIDNNTLTISNMQANFINPGDVVDYTYVIKNIGDYDAYINFSDYANLYIGGLSKQCTAGNGTTESLVSEACNSINLIVTFGKANSDGTQLEFLAALDNYPQKPYKIEPGDFLLMGVVIAYDTAATRADGPFSVSFEDVQLEFSTTP